MPKAAITRIPNLEIFQENPNKRTGLYLQKLTQAQINAIPTAPTTDSMVVSNSTTGTIQISNNGVVRNVNTSVATAGTGLTTGIPIVVPVGTLAAVETDTLVNRVQGFIYYNTTGSNWRGYNGAAWGTFTFVAD